METLTISKNEYNSLTRRYGKHRVDLHIDRVNRGAAALDKAKPRWVYDIIPEKLDLTSASLCVCGQVFGDYFERTVGKGNAAASHGFTNSRTPDSFHENALLDVLWTTMIEQRHSRRRHVFIKKPGKFSRWF